MSARLYASVILPLAVEGNFTYAVPEGMEQRVGPGRRVIVPFGQRRFYTGLVESVSPEEPKGLRVREIALALDDAPVVREPAIRFWRWIASYYLCTVGEVFKAALPAGLKIESDTRLQVLPEPDEQALATVAPDEVRVLDFVRRQGQASVGAIEKELELKRAGATVSALVDKGLLGVSEKLAERFRAVRKPYVSPALERGDGAAVEAALSALNRSPRQQAALVGLLALSEFNRPGSPLVEVPLDVLLDRTGCTRTHVRALAERGFARIYAKEISRFSYDGTPAKALPTLSPAQDRAMKQIEQSWETNDITLLHGVTSSGKTEIYIHLIDKALRQGRQALLLVPEIALTTQLTARLQSVFGDKVVIYHSKFSDNERVEMWRRVLAGAEPVVAVGARSAVFLPFSSLGLVIVDEEHEASYKQADPAPRYNGRDAASVLARMHGAKTLYGSATPAIDTYYKAQSGRFGLVSLTERYEGMALPEIEIVDMRRHRVPRGEDLIFSPELVEAAKAAKDKGRQSIIFHNRRGYAPMARCSACGFVPKCDFCDVSLTYHRHVDRLQCHYCGADYAVPTVCPQCGEPAIEVVGFGTERLEEELAAKFEGFRVLRMDLDTTRVKDGYSKIIDAFSQGRADILVGTQMVTKGLDFGGVQTVGVVSADSLINFPDFRAGERAFNMIEQVAGRAGRRDVRGKVLLQTFKPDQPLLAYAAAHDYAGFYAAELEERRNFGFPPFSRIINILVKHRDRNTAAECARLFAGNLRRHFGNGVLGPQEPHIARIQNLYIRKIMLRIAPDAHMADVRRTLREEYISLQASPIMKGLSIYYDVDPV